MLPNWLIDFVSLIFRYSNFNTRIIVGKSIDKFIVTFTEMFFLFLLFLAIILFISSYLSALVDYLKWRVSVPSSKPALAKYSKSRYVYQALCLHWLNKQSWGYLHQAVCLHWTNTQSGEGLYQAVSLHWMKMQGGEYLYQAVCLQWLNTQSGESGEYLY